MNVVKKGKVLCGAFLLVSAVQAREKLPVVIRGAEVIGGPVTPGEFIGDVRDLPKVPEWKKGMPVKEIPRRSYPPEVDRSKDVPFTKDLLVDVQRKGVKVPDRAFSTPTLVFDGSGYSGATPPDTVGDVGPNHYIQIVNSSGGASVRIYDKSGNMLAGPFAMDSLATGGNCTSGFGDGIVLYDWMADRWIMMEFVSGGNNLCVYVSKTADPVSGGWWFYDITAPPSFPDYPKLSVWHDGYYITSNEGGSTRPIYALDRANMLNGATMRPVQRFTVSSLPGYSFQLLSPVDHDGPNPPPAGSPAYFLRHYDDEAHSGSPDPNSDYLELYELSVDWNNPSNSVLQGPLNIQIADFNSKFEDYSTFYSVPQPNSTTELDPIREVVFHRPVYRKFDTYEVIVGVLPTNLYPTSNNNDVSAALRWFELRNTGSGWQLYQEGTFDGAQPLSQNRFVASIAMDQAGNMAMGYSFTDIDTNNPVYPSIYYTGRVANDPTGVMSQGDNVIVVGQGAQNNSGRWGDYAAMSIDPSDDCTFWFTTEYIPDASGQWATKIAAFKFDTCGCQKNIPPISDLNASVAGNNNIELTWSDSSHPDITEYRIYRSMTQGGPYNLIHTEPDISPGVGGSGSYQWNDTSVSGGTTYYYVIKAYDGDKCLGPPSNEASATATGTCLFSPNFAGASNVEAPFMNSCSLVVKWNHGTSNCGGGTDLRYNVYRSTTPGFTPDNSNLIASNVSGTSYLDGGVNYGSYYYYIVRAVDPINGNEETNTVEVVGTPKGALTGPTNWSDDVEAYSTIADAVSAGWGHGASQGTDDWRVDTTDPYSGSKSFASDDVNEITDKWLISPEFVASSSSSLTFWHKYNFEATYDGGVLEISTDGGTTWQDLGSYITQGGYTGTIDGTYGNPIGGRSAWTGSQTTYTQVTVDLSAFNGSAIQVRWRIGTDSSIGAGTWYIDDITFNAVYYPGSCSALTNIIFINGGNEPGDDSWSAHIE